MADKVPRDMLVEVMTLLKKKGLPYEGGIATLAGRKKAVGTRVYVEQLQLRIDSVKEMGGRYVVDYRVTRPWDADVAQCTDVVEPTEILAE